MPVIQVSVGKSQSGVVVRPLATGQMWRDRWGRWKHAFHPPPLFPRKQNWIEVKLPASYPHTLQCGWKPIWGLSVFKVIDGPLVFNRLDTGLQVHTIKPNMHMRPDTCLPPPTPFLYQLHTCVHLLWKCIRAVSGWQAKYQMIPPLIYMRKIHYLKTRFDNFDYHWKKKIRQKIKRRALETVGRSSVSKCEMEYKNFTRTIVVSIQIYE